MAHICTLPGLYFDCANGFRGCCTLNPCVQEEPICPCASAGGSSISADQTAFVTRSTLPTILVSTLMDQTIPANFPTNTLFTISSPIGPPKSIPSSANELVPTSAAFSTANLSPVSTNPPEGPLASPAKAKPIIGGILGSLAGLAGLAGLAYWLLRGKRRKCSVKFKFKLKRESTKETTDNVIFKPVEDIERPQSPVHLDGIGQSSSKGLCTANDSGKEFRIQRKPVPS